MRNFGTIYKYEIKKLTGRKLFWITALLCVVGIVITTFAGLWGTYYVDGEAIESHFEGFQKDQKYRQELSGKAVDQELLQETVDAYAHVPTDVPRYTLTEEYQTFARPYSPIFNLIRSFTGMDLLTIQNWEVDEAALLAEIPSLRERVGDRAVLRALHFVEENKRVEAQAKALRANDLDAYFAQVLASGRSSFCYLQNVYTAVNLREQGLSLALLLAERELAGKCAAWRVHGGGFAGTIQAYVPLLDVDGFCGVMDGVFGKGACHVLHIRPVGAVRIA